VQEAEHAPALQKGVDALRAVHASSPTLPLAQAAQALLVQIGLPPAAHCVDNVHSTQMPELMMQ